MSTDLAIETINETEGTDYRWLGAPNENPRGISASLDLTEAGGLLPHLTPLGTVRSGIAVGQITESELYGLYDPTATDGREVLAGFVRTDVNVFTQKGKVQASGKSPFSLMKHGLVVVKYLPIAAQRSITYLTPNSGQFVFTGVSAA